MTAIPPPAPPQQSVPKAPPSPGRLFVWVAAWLLVAAAGYVVLAHTWQAAIASELYGQRTSGIVIFTPILATVMAVVVLIRAIWAIGATRAYQALWSPEQRAAAERASIAGQPSGFFIVIGAILGVIWLAGVVVVLIFLPALLQNPTGLSLAIMLLALLAMAWIPAILAGVRRRGAAAGNG